MDDRTGAAGGWLSTGLAILCPVSAVTVSALGDGWALAGLLWMLGAACPLAWLAGERRVARQEAEILAAVGDRSEEETTHERRA
jgi:hypothetical protein